MGKQRTLSPAEQLLQQSKPISANPLQATPMYNSEYAQRYEGLPVNNETLALGVQNDLAFTTEGYSSQIAKNVGAALVNTLGFAASTVLSIPNLIDNQFNDGNDRIIKPLNEMQNSALENFQSYQNPGNEDQSVMEWLTPSFISGNTKSFWGDLIEQSGIIAGTTLGTGALLGAARFLPGMAAAETAVGTAVKGALSKVLKPATLLGEQLGMSKALVNTVNSQKFINGLASATKTAGLNAVQSYTEALFQGLDGERSFVEDRIKEYETKFGYRPEGTELQEIENTARELKDTTFKFNMAGLMISNTPFTKAFFGEAPANFLTRLGKLGSTLDSAGKIVTKELDFLKGKSPYLAKPINFLAYKSPIALSEGFEEIYQMGVEKGMDNYYTNKLNTEDFEANFSNVSKAISAGAKSILTKEGLKAFIAGAGVGGIFQGGNNFMQQRSLNQYLDKTTTVRDPLTKQEKEITNREDILSNIKDIDSTVDGVFSLDPLAKNPTSLNQTFGERVQQFVTDNNNLQDSVKAEGSYIEYDQTQRTKFDSLYPYVKKGYKDVIVSKIEGAYQDLNKAELSDAQRQTLANQKQSALEDVNTVENFVNTIDNVFYEQFQDSSVQRIHTQLKDIAVYHLWNTENINRQSKELTAIYGDNLFEDEIAKGFTGTNITAILNKEIAKLQPQSPEIDLNADERAIFEKIKNSENPTEAYFAYKQRNKPDGLLSSKDFLVLKKQKEYLQNRLKTNGDVLVNLSNVKNDPGKSFNFLLNYHGQAENIVKKTKTKVDTQETINKNQNLITKNVAPELQEGVEKELGKKMESPLTITQVKEAEEVVKKETKQLSSPENSQKDEKDADKKNTKNNIKKEEKSDIERSNINREKSLTTFTYKDHKGSDMTIAESIITYLNGSTEKVSDILDPTKQDSHWRLKEIINSKYDAELKALEQTVEIAPEVISPIKPRRKRQESAKSKTGSKIFSDYIPKKDIQDAIKKLEEEKAIALSEGPLNEFLFETMMDKDEAIAMITQQYNELIQKEKDSQKTTTAERRLEGTTEGATITSEVLDDSESHLFYDIGLIRTQLHTGPKEIYTINLKDVEGNLVPAFTIQNNKDNFLIDLVLFNQFLDQYKEDPILKPYINQLKQTESKMPFVKFLEVLLVLPESSGNEIFNFIQNTVFELKTDVETAVDITEKGSVLKLFNFKGETLETLYQRLKAENNLYNIFQTNKNTEEILSKLDIKIKDSNPIKLADYTMLIKDSGAIGVVQVSNGEILSTLSITPEIRIKLAEQGVANNKEGYYAVFPTEGKYFLPGVRVSLGYEDLSEAGKMNFKVGFYYGDKNDFWNVRVLEDGKYELVNTSSKENKILENYDIFAKWMDDTKNKLKANITYFEKTQSTLQTIFEKGRVNHVVYKNNSVQITPLNESYQEPIEENNMKPIEINELFEEPQENETAKFSWKIEKNGQYAVISNTMKVGEDTYILNPGITEDEVENFLGDSKKATVFLKVKDLVKNSGFYTKIENPNYSTVSNYQLDKIKEFIEKC